MSLPDIITQIWGWITRPLSPRVARMPVEGIGQVGVAILKPKKVRAMVLRTDQPFSSRLVARCIVDENNRRIFHHWQQVMNLEFSIAIGLWVACYQAHGLDLDKIMEQRTAALQRSGPENQDTR